MGNLADWQIIEAASKGMITPFERKSIDITIVGDKWEKIISYGPSSYGYDCRLAPQYKLFNPQPGAIIDPKRPDPKNFILYEGDTFIMPPHSYMLGVTIENFDIPADVLVKCLGRSTYARCGIVINVTPAEPEWIGELTLEIFNPTPASVKIYGNEGICQLIFQRGDAPCRWTYKTKNGGKPSKYQNQKGITHAIL